MNKHPNYRVSVEIILMHEDKILLTKRSTESVVAPGVWNVPAGKVKFNEIPAEAAIREVKEETNMDLQGLKEIHVRTFEGQTASEPIYRLLYTYVVNISEQQLKNFQLNEEHSESRWVTREELHSKDFDSLLPAFRSILLEKAWKDC
ncbi:NUDIX hydrolase [Paenisporosarcina quisquiliarum]|uniref:NUDIX hydrolase n=1 Tax=Paenisporosarcina quisquiliarum TaxID=365346 RepID=UPI0037369A9D